MTYHKRANKSANKSARKLPIELPIVVRKLRCVKVDKFGCELRSNRSIRRWWVPMGSKLVWEFDILFKDSYNGYDTDYVRAVNISQAKKLIQQRYPYASYRWE